MQEPQSAGSDSLLFWKLEGLVGVNNSVYSCLLASRNHCAFTKAYLMYLAQDSIGSWKSQCLVSFRFCVATTETTELNSDPSMLGW